MAVKTVVMSLRHFVTQRSRSWYHALPIALWGLNDLPGPVAPYSPHRLVFGGDPVGLEEVHPTSPGDGAEDAQPFSSRLMTERQQVRTALKRLHDKKSGALRKKLKVQPFRGGGGVWLRDRPKWDQPHYNKLKRKWQGPYEVIRWEGGIFCVSQVAEAQRVVASDCLKFYRSMLEKVTVPFSYYSDRQLAPNEDTHMVGDVLDQAVKRPRGASPYLQLYVAWKDHEDKTWEDAGKFIGRGNDRVERYCTRHGPSPRKLHPVFRLKGGICVQKKRRAISACLHLKTANQKTEESQISFFGLSAECK